MIKSAKKMSDLKKYNITTSFPNGELNLTKLGGEIEGSGAVKNFTGLTQNKKSLTIEVHGESIINESSLDLIVSNHEMITLDELKAEKVSQIDIRTFELISSGFVYQSKVFSLSSSAQTNILALFTTRDHPVVVYPIIFNTINDDDTYFVADSLDLEMMCLTAMSTKKSYIDDGTLLKDKVRMAQTKAAVMGIVDHR